MRDAGSMHDAGIADAGLADGGPHAEGPCQGPPGLYADETCTRIADGLRPYTPRYPFWSDGASKERFIHLPPGTRIDAEDPDWWTYPLGTRIYKTFTRDGVRLETRLMEKIAAEPGVDSWRFQAFAWSADQKSVELVDEDGRPNVLGTSHDIPSVASCRACHSAAGQDGVNGFSAIQLNHWRTAFDLEDLLAEGLISTPLGDDLLDLAVVPGDEGAQLALGTLHTNCGICHGGETPRGQMTLRLHVGELDVPSTALYQSAVGQPLRVWLGRRQPNGLPYVFRAVPGSAARSAIIARMSVRGSRDQMPPLGSELIDSAGMAAVSAWLDSLGTHDAPSWPDWAHPDEP